MSKMNLAGRDDISRLEEKIRKFEQRMSSENDMEES